MMQTRYPRMLNGRLSFEEVTVKEEPQDVKEESLECDENGTSTSHQGIEVDSDIDTPKNPRKEKHLPCKIAVRMRNQCTQVTPEDIDCSSSAIFNQKWNKAIDPSNLGEIIPQCRLCLRRIPRDNLDIIVTEHKKKARFAFQLRIFPHDAYPFICSTCSNLMNMFIDFKQAVTRAKYLLIQNQAHLQSEGWDDPDYKNALEKCRHVVRNHRKQIDAMYGQTITAKECKSPEEGEIRKIVENNSIDDSASVKEELSINPTSPQAERVEKRTKEVKTQEAVSPELIPDDSTDEEFVPEDDESDEEVTFKKPKISKIKSTTPKITKTEKATNKPMVSRQLCDFCGASVRPESVESHKNAHLGIRPYACSAEDCNLTFTSRFNLGKHIKRIHKQREVHTCNMCGKQIRGSITVLKYHQQRHNVDEKRYICQVCGKGFTMKWYLTQHSIIHSGVFPHKCKYCGKKFNNKWSMKTHEKNIHEKNNAIKIVDLPSSPGKTS